MSLLSALIYLSAPALAEDPTFAGTDTSGQKADAPEATLSAEIGGAFASGNVQYLTLNALLTGGYRWEMNKLAGKVGANIGQSIADTDADGILSDTERAAGMVETSRRLDTEARYDRYIGEKASLYLLGGAFIDPFAGYDLRSHEQLGYSRILIKSDKTNLLTELGGDVAQEFYVEGVDPESANIFAARLLVGLQHQFNDSVSFSEKVELYENVLSPTDLRLLNEAAVTSKLSDKFSLKLSNQLIFDNVPVEGFAKYDQVTLVTLVASIL